MKNNGWISVKDRLPDFKKKDGYRETNPILLTGGDEFFTGYFFYTCRDNLDFDTIPSDEYGIMSFPTHWQELPKMPSECEEITTTCQERVDIGAKP
jgi:hypothetical protein